MGVLAGHDDVLDLVYETTIDPNLWPRLLARFNELMGGRGAAFRSYDLFSETGTVMAVGFDSDTLDRQFRTFADRNPLKSSPEELRRKFQTQARHGYVPGMKRDVEWLPKDEFVRTEYYSDFYRPFDIHADVSIGLDSEAPFWTGIDVYRSERQGAFGEDELALCAALMPHMSRALKLGRRLSDARGVGDGVVDFIDRSPHGLFILDRAGRLRHANATGRRLLEQAKGLRSVDSRLLGVTQDATRRLQALIDRAGAKDQAKRTGGSMALANPDGQRPLSVIVAPMGAEHAAPMIGGPAVMVCVTDLDALVRLPEERLRDLFDLTPAEGRVAIALFEGLDPRLAADRLDISLWTVRRHLAQIFEKTQTGGQVELARLMMRIIGAGAT